MTGLDNGYGSPFVRIFYNDEELSAFVTKFQYEYFEEGDDVCTLGIQSDDRGEPDKPYWQEKAELKIIWGYLDNNGTTEGQISPVRKIFVQQVKWRYSGNGIEGTIECTEKAVSMKYTDSQEVHSNESLLSLAKKMADKHNVNPYLELVPGEFNDYYAPVVPGETADNYWKRNRDAINKRDLNKIIDATNKNPDSVKVLITQQTVDWAKNYAHTHREVNGHFNHDRDSAYISSLQFDPDKLAQKFNIYPSIPQANKTDKQLLEETASREGNGPWLVDTRDGDLTIKKRNFKQTPYKSYIFGGDEGSLLEFTPMSKNRGRIADSQNVGFSNWDAMNKTPFWGNANALPDDNETLVKTRKMYTFYKNAENHGLGNNDIEQMTPTIGTSSNIGEYQVDAKADNTLNYKKVNLKKGIKVSDAVNILKAALDDVYNQSINNNQYNPLGNDPQSAFDMASNARRNAELKMNPATAQIYGDPNLKTGILITIMEVSTKFSGNHYVTKATHTIDQNGYMVNLEMATQGNNLKTSSNVKVLGKFNRSIGPSTGQGESKKITKKTNP